MSAVDKTNIPARSASMQIREVTRMSFTISAPFLIHSTTINSKRLFAVTSSSTFPTFLVSSTELHRITKPGGILKIVTPHYSNPDWATDPTHRNHFNSYSFTCFVPSRTPFPFYTSAELNPVTTHVSLANLWRALGLEFVVNLDQRWPSFRFTTKVLGVLSLDDLSRQGTLFRTASRKITSLKQSPVLH